MAEKKITSLVIMTLPKSLDCLIGGKGVDPAGGRICAIFDDGSYKEIAMTSDEVVLSCPAEKEGNALATVTYMGQSQMFQVYVRKPVIRKFSVVSTPNKINYLAGEKLDLTGLKLNAEYETGERTPYENIPEVDYTVKYGDAVYPLVIDGLSIPIFIKVSEATLTGIRMGKLPMKTEYLERKEKFDPTGGTIIQEFNSGKEQEIPLPYSAVRGFSNLTPGPLNLQVQMGQFTTSFQITIIEKKAIRVSIDTPPFRTTYTEGESIVMDGVRVSVEYNNGESRISDEWNYEPKKAILGQDLVVVTVGDASATLAINVAPRRLLSIRVSKPPNKTQYKERLEQLDVQGAELELNFDYGDPEIVPVESSMVKGFDNRRAGECKVEVQYQGLAAEFSVDILPQTLLGIMITQMPEKVDYAPGDSFDPKGMVVSGFYDSGIIEPIRSYAVSPDRPLQDGDVAILISSVGKTAVVPIKVGEMFRPKPEEPQPWDTDIQTPIPDPSDTPAAQPRSMTPDPYTAPVVGPDSEVEFHDPFSSVASLFGRTTDNPPVANPGFGFMPADEETPLFGKTPSNVKPKPESEEKKKSGFWGRKLFGPNTSKFRGEE